MTREGYFRNILATNFRYKVAKKYLVTFSNILKNGTLQLKTDVTSFGATI